jgi:hypothetical protein
MSCDTDYKLTVYSENKKDLQDLKKYCKFKKERWDSWSSSGRNADELLKETGEKDYSDVVSWGYQWGNIRKFGESYKMEGTSWANENCSNLHIKGSNGELASIAKRFPDIEWEVEFEDEYDWSGTVYEPNFEP